MELDFGYVALYGMFRFVIKIGMSLMGRLLVMNYVSFMLD
jgi:hypothetical protein